MSENVNVPLFKGRIASGATVYVPVPIHKDGGGRWIGAQLSWLDATSSATVTLELTNTEAAYTQDGAAHEWKDSAVSITGPAAAAAGSTLIAIENVRFRRARLKIVTAAVSQIVVWDGDNPNDPGDGTMPGVTR
jgi:hypothetical protein